MRNIMYHEVRRLAVVGLGRRETSQSPERVVVAEKHTLTRSLAFGTS